MCNTVPVRLKTGLNDGANLLSSSAGIRSIKSPSENPAPPWVNRCRHLLNTVRTVAVTRGTAVPLDEPLHRRGAKQAVDGR